MKRYLGIFLSFFLKTELADVKHKNIERTDGSYLARQEGALREDDPILLQQDDSGRYGDHLLGQHPSCGRERVGAVFRAVCCKLTQ